MSRFISKAGKWYPAKEKTALVNHSSKTLTIFGKRVKPGEPYIYDGPDRAALLDIWLEHKGNQETLGEDFRRNPDFLQAIRTRGFSNVKEFLEFIGYDEEQVEKDFKKNASEINKHELPKAVKAIEKMGGGMDSSGSGKDKLGGFGAAPDVIG